MTAQDLLLEYKQVVYDILGTYHDTRMGCLSGLHKLEFDQIKAMQEFHLTQEEIDSRVYGYSTASPANEEFQIFHESTQGEFKARNREGGRNISVLGQLVVTQIYSYWEDHYRGKLSEAVNKEKGEMLSDIFGELRHYRHDIIHHRGIAQRKVAECKLLALFDENEQIELSMEQIDYIVLLVNEEINKLVKLYSSEQTE